MANRPRCCTVTDLVRRGMSWLVTWPCPMSASVGRGDGFTASPCGCRPPRICCSGRERGMRHGPYEVSPDAVSTFRVASHDGEYRPWAANPKRWQTKSRRWVTAFPAIHERRRPLDLDEISRWCRHAGLPKPLAFRHARTPLVRGAADLAPIEVNRPGRVGMPYSHIELVFAEPVHGPIAIGSGRQRGFGLCVPVEQGED